MCGEWCGVNIGVFMAEPTDTGKLSDAKGGVATGSHAAASDGQHLPRNAKEQALHALETDPGRATIAQVPIPRWAPRMSSRNRDRRTVDNGVLSAKALSVGDGVNP